MGRRLRRCLAAFVLLCAFEAGAERVVSFEVDVHVEASGEMLVVEQIVYDFGELQRHGIYRDVPVRYDRATADWRIALEVVSVGDEYDAARPWTTSREGRNLRIRIGDSGRKVTGVQHYRIRYRVSRAVLFFEEHDEIYWNVTGNEWRVPIDAASASLTLPRQVAADLRVGCFTGAQGSRYSECEANVTPAGTGWFSTRRALAPGEGLTLVLGLPKGVVHEPTASERWLARVRDFLGIATLLPLAALGFMTWLWRRTGSDRGASDAIAVRYEPPEGLSPAEVGTIVDESADVSDVTATILDLAVRGHLRIHELTSRKFLFLSDTDYRLERLASDETLKPFERKLLTALFGGADSVKVSDLRYEFHEHLAEIVVDLYDELSRGPQRFFPTAPHKVRRRWAGAGLFGVGLGVVLGGSVLDFPDALGVGATGAIVAGFAKAMPRRTRHGRRAYEEIVGFREFVQRVDADRLQRAGTDTQERFEALLPYAVVLGVADAWADAFAGLATRPPTWYEGTSTRFEPRLFVDDLGRCLHSTSAALSAPPPSSGSGSSGFSGGGGMSGGGFGGGGGGSW